MRIIAGEFRSRMLRSPIGLQTRPTSDRLRERLFSILAARAGGDLVGLRFLDLYAGSGANGLEALSRGAREAVFVEQAEPALTALRANIASLGVGSRARLAPSPVGRWLQSAGDPFDLVFLDPPYDAAGEYAAALGRLGEHGSGLLAPGALVIAEHRLPRRKGGSPGAVPELGGPGERYGLLHRVRLLEQGEAALSFYSPELPASTGNS